MMEGYDQTQFIAEEPLYEKPVPVANPQQSEQPSKPKSRLPLFIGAGAVVVLLMIIALALAARRQPIAQPGEETSSEQVSPAMGPFKQQLSELNQQLQAADPTKEDLPFPPVDMHITLQEK